MATHVSYDEYVVPELVAEIRTQFDMAPSGGLVVPAPFNRRQDVQEQSIRDAEIAPDRNYPKGYQPDTLPFWPSDKPIFLPENMVPEQMKKKSKP
jgi:ribonuclease Z